MGKTTIIEPLKILLGSGFEVRDFDERGVPDNVGKQWRLNETQYWIALGIKNAGKGVSTVICGFVKPSEINNPTVVPVLLDADETTIYQRLRKRYQTPKSVPTIERISRKPVQKFIDDNVYYSAVMRKEAQSCQLKIIETSKLSPNQVAKEVADYLKDI